jgi:TfoX/Sxy family transcriptional regulator of competence genes
MAYDEGLIQRIREFLADQSTLDERKMFGGIAFMVQGNMACGVLNDALIARVGPEQYREALENPYTSPFDITGRAMKGWVMVGPGGYESEDGLRSWIRRGVDFALTLPPKR